MSKALLVHPDDGITTLEEKSLGAMRKARRATVCDLIRHGGQGARAGLALREAPGNDAVSCTALAAAGAAAIPFTTGCVTSLGFPVPTLNIASTNMLAARTPEWIDLAAGAVLERGFGHGADDLLAKLCHIPSGAPTAAARDGEREIAIWKRGVTP